MLMKKKNPKVACNLVVQRVVCSVVSFQWCVLTSQSHVFVKKSTKAPRQGAKIKTKIKKPDLIRT